MDRLKGIRAEGSFKFLRLLKKKPADKSTLGRQLGFTEKTIEEICGDLEYRDLIDHELISGDPVISRAGSIAVEEVLSNPDRASTHFPPLKEMLEEDSTDSISVEEPLSDHQAHLLYGAIRSEYSEFSVSKMREVAAAAGFDVTRMTARSEKKTGIGSRAELMPQVDQQFGEMDLDGKIRALKIICKRIIDRQAFSELDLNQALKEHEFQFLDGRFLQLKKAPEPSTNKHGQKLETPKYTGATITMDFINADVVNVLRLLAEVANFNVQLNAQVRGVVSFMRIHNRPWDEVFDLVLMDNNLAKRTIGDTIWITTKAHMAQIEAEERYKAEQEARNTTPSRNLEGDEQVEKAMDPRKVLVVHGRNEKARKALFQFLTSLRLDPLEWSHMVASTGEGSPYIGRVLDQAFDEAQAVVVLLTGDDEAILRQPYRKPDDHDYESRLTPQARPNVLFEAGMAFGRSPKRTILVQLGSMRPISDILGRHIIRIDDSIEKRQELANRLVTAGCPANMKGTDWHRDGEFGKALAEN